MKTIVLVDSQALFREGLKCLFAGHAKYTVVGEAENGASGVSEVERHMPDVVITDIALSLGSGFDLLENVRRLSPQSASIILADRAPDTYVISAVRHGARGYLLKTDGFKCLISCLDEIAYGKIAYAPAISRRIPELFQSSLQQNEGGLSTRETEVVRIYAEGHTTAEVAKILGISVKTVDSYRNHIFLKLHIKQHGYTRYAIENGLVGFERVA